MFHLSYDEDRRLVTATLTGFWDMPTFLAFERERVAIHRKIGERHRHYRYLSQATEFPVQLPEIGSAFNRLVTGEIASNKGPLAIVAGTLLNKMQAQRGMPIPNLRVFMNREEAMAWLFEAGRLPE